MEYRTLTNRRATAITPQIVTVIVDDSGSMKGEKCQKAAVGIRDMVITMQSGNQNSNGYRFLVNLAKFGTETQEIACAAAPEEVSLSQLDFSGGLNGTEMIHALNWAHQAVQTSLAKCRQIPGFLEARTPTPLLVFLSDGDNNGPDISEATRSLKSIKFGEDRSIDIVAAGIGMEQRDFKVMESIASRSSLAANIEPSRLSEFLAAIAATVLAGEPPVHLATKFL